MIVFGGVGAASIMIPIVPQVLSYSLSTIQIVTIVLVNILFGIPAFIAFLFVPCGLICFSANVIQYGIDLLHDAPMKTLSCMSTGMSGQATLDNYQ